MLHGSNPAGPPPVSRKDLPVQVLVDAFLRDKEGHCTPGTIRRYKGALGCLERQYSRLPWVSQELIAFVQAEPLCGNSKRVLYETLRDFYNWVQARGDSLAPTLPHVYFGRRRLGERRGRKLSGG